MSTMALPYSEPLVPREPGERRIPEPPIVGSLPGTMWLASRPHFHVRFVPRPLAQM